MFSKDILARMRVPASCASARDRREPPKIVATAKHGGWIARIVGKRYWWVHFRYALDDTDYNVCQEWMADNGAGRIWRLMPDRIAFSDEDDWVMFKVAFA